MTQPHSDDLALAMRRALVDEPGQVSALNQAIEASFLVFDPVQIASWSRRALAVDRHTALPLVALGHVARSQGSAEPPLPLYRRAAALDPGYEPAWTGVGAAALEAEHDNEAVAGFGRALSLAPFSAIAAKNLAEALRLRGRPREALRLARRAVALAPNLPQSHYNLGIVEHDLEQIEEAARSLTRALALVPRDADALYALGTVDLQRGRLVQGWIGHEARWDRRNAPQPRPFAVPHWTGKPVSGALLLWGEQGLGDEILMSSVLQDVEPLADRVVIECDPRLVSILSRSFPRFSVVARRNPPDSGTQAHDIVAQCAVASLPLYLRTRPDSFHQRAALRPDPGRVDVWRAWLDGLGPGLKVGFAWRSSRTDRQARHIHPPLSAWRPLFSVPAVTWIPMQYGDFHDEFAAEMRRSPTRSVARPDLDLFNDLEGVLALGASLDLMISSVTTSHCLPAAAGTETWLALRQRSVALAVGPPDCLWFSRMRAFSIDSLGDWATATDAIARDLRTRALSHAP